jgi:hypothetical protein
MFCPRCGKEYDESFNFCPKCGTNNPYIEAPPASPTPQAPTPQPPPKLPVKTGKKPTPGWLIALAITCVLGMLGLWMISFLVPVYLNSRCNSQRRTCQSNLRTVDGAIQAYEAMFDTPTPPTSLDDMTQPGTRVLRSIPTCPSGNKPYILVPDNPPYISCPNNASHTI